MTPLAMIAAWVIIGLAVFLLGPYLPAWLGFALPLVVVAYGAVQLVLDGPEASEITLVVVFAALAALVWWRAKYPGGGEQPRSPGGKSS